MARGAARQNSNLTCRQCQSVVPADAPRCANCDCPAPFACARCGKALSSVSLNVKRSHKYPYGAYSAEGEPLCAEHRPTRCYQCQRLLDMREMKRRQVGVHADTNLRHGMAPRMEKVYGSFCPDCYRNPKRSDDGTTAPPNYAALWVALIATVVVVAGGLVVILLTRH